MTAAPGAVPVAPGDPGAPPRRRDLHRPARARGGPSPRSRATEGGDAAPVTAAPGGAAPSGTHDPRPGFASRAVGAAARVVLAVVVLVGAGALGWTAWSAATGAQLVEFATGSMTPTYPTGAVAVVVPVAAPDVRPGDVVTVRRDAGGLPVTHRVVSVAETGDPATRSLVLQGDANDTPDLAPYDVTEVGRVVAGSAELGAALRTVRHPAALAVLTVVAAAAVLRAFWPTRES